MSTTNDEVVAGIDVHKSMLAVVVARPGQKETEYVSAKFGAGQWQLRELTDWLLKSGVSRVAMESTAQYWKPVWYVLEPSFQLVLAQPRSTAAPPGRKTDFADAKRIVRRLLADDLTVSFVPAAEQRLLTRARTASDGVNYPIKESDRRAAGRRSTQNLRVLSDLLGLSGWRMLQALAKGESDPAVLAQMAHEHVHASQDELRETLNGRIDSANRLLLKHSLDQIEQLRKQVMNDSRR